MVFYRDVSWTPLSIFTSKLSYWITSMEIQFRIQYVSITPNAMRHPTGKFMYLIWALPCLPCKASFHTSIHLFKEASALHWGNRKPAILSWVPIHYPTVFTSEGKAERRRSYSEVGWAVPAALFMSTTMSLDSNLVSFDFGVGWGLCRGPGSNRVNWPLPEISKVPANTDLVSL